MRNKNVVIILLAVFAVICGYNLWHTSQTFSIENELRDADSATYKTLTSDAEYMEDYRTSQQSSLSLGLDLQGGMFVTLEIGMEDLLRERAGYPEDSLFENAIKNAKKARVTNSQRTFVDLFQEEFNKLKGDKNISLAAYFDTEENDLTLDSPDGDVIAYLEEVSKSAFDNTLSIIRTRIDQFGVASPNIQPQPEAGRILVELPGVREPERVEKLLGKTATLEFYETYPAYLGLQEMEKANDVVKRILKAESPDSLSDDTTGTDVSDNDTVPGANDPVADVVDAAADDVIAAANDTTDTNGVAATDTTGLDSATAEEEDTVPAWADTTRSEDERSEAWVKEYPMFEGFSPTRQEDINAWNQNPVLGYMHYNDTAKMNRWLRHPDVKAVFSSDLKFVWGAKRQGNSDFLPLLGCKTSSDGLPALDGEDVKSAKQDYSSDGKNEPVVSLVMTLEGSKEWAEVTGRNVDYAVAIVMDDLAYSWPRVNQQITGGRSEISGGFDLTEAKDLANLLNSGKLPVTTRIIGKEVVGPTLGEKNVDAGMNSFIIAFIVTVIFMVFYYTGAGLVANLALIANLFFILGVSSSFNVVLTLPGIAAIVLTMGMAVDANVLIFERIREEQALGKSLKASITSGFKNAFSSVMDANITTFLTGVVLFAFGLGPIRGFAVNLMIGIITSLISALFITRLILDFYADKGKDSIKFGSKMTVNIFKKIDINMVSRRKIGYAVSAVLIVASCISFATNGFKAGVDFMGGRQYRIEFAGELDVPTARKDLESQFGVTPVIKTIGGSENEVLVTTSYKIEDAKADAEVEELVKKGILTSHPNAVPTINASTKVGATVAEDIERSAYYSVIFSLIIIFLYILIRFRRWQYSLGALAALVHDVIITLGFFSFLGTTDILPFSIDIDQAFIAALLTIVGYSINDTVVVFDRIRENLGEMKTSSLSSVFNISINQTISRTLVTSVTTLLTILVLFFLGGDTIKGFMFALLVGIIFGTYSSIFVASPIAHDLINRGGGQSNDQDAQS